MMYLLVVKHPDEKFPREYECKDEVDLYNTFIIHADSDDDEVEFYDEFHQIFPEWAQ